LLQARNRSAIAPGGNSAVLRGAGSGCGRCDPGALRPSAKAATSSGSTTQPVSPSKQELERFARQQPLQAGFVLSAVGSLRQATLRLADQTEDCLLAEPLEILSLSGSLCPDGVHLHLAVANAQGRTWGGHLRPGCLIYTTAEVVLADSLEYRFSRQLDPATGYLELHIEKVAKQPLQAAEDT
jgi:predicted DNA-binding protein with PD1-like motif